MIGKQTKIKFSPRQAFDECMKMLIQDKIEDILESIAFYYLCSNDKNFIKTLVCQRLPWAEAEIIKDD